MLAPAVVLMVLPVWGFQSPHHEQAFLSAAIAAVPEEGPGMEVSRLSTTMKCVINLTLQYVTIFTALGICRSYLDFQQMKYEESAVQKALKHASETVFYAPMACLLFVGFRMRVVQLTKGTGNPQEFAQMGMQAVAYSILANTLLVLIIPVFTKYAMDEEKEVEVDKNTGEMKVDGQNPFANNILAVLFSCIRYASFLALYVGFGVVVYGLFTFEPNPGVWDGPVPEVSPAVFCTCILSCAFFTIYCLLAFARTYSQFTQQNMSTFETVMLGAADTLAMAPMFCVLFLGARMRALQMDPVNGNPQPWAQNCFYACTYALLTQTVLATFVPLCLNDVSIKRDGLPEGDMTVDTPSQPMLAKVLTVGRWLIMLSIYAGATAVVCSVFTQEHPDGKEWTPSVSPTMHCVINFSFQYFFIYMLVWVFYTIEHFSGWKGLARAKDAVESAKATVQFAPMLCVLFIATRMRALQITNNQGAPQKYVQDGMYLATWSVIIQFTMCLAMPLLTGLRYKADSLDGKKVENPQLDNYYGAMTVTILRYLAMILMLGGMTTVITGVFLMTPENANGRGSIRSHIPLVGEHLPSVPKPMTASDVPHADKIMESTGEGIGAGVNAADDGVNAVGDGAKAVTGQ
jgi:hypothetical protein